MIQNAVKEFLGREDLDRHVNGDEGAAIGAAFFAAGLSASFRVKEVRLRDITHYPVNVKINLDQAGDADNEIVIEEEEGWFEIVFFKRIFTFWIGEDKTNTALIARGNKLNTRKSLTFYSYSNFSLDLAYSQPESLPVGSKYELFKLYLFIFNLVTKEGHFPHHCNWNALPPEVQSNWKAQGLRIFQAHPRRNSCFGPHWGWVERFGAPQAQA